jgi:hypothetical protein
MRPSINWHQPIFYILLCVCFLASLKALIVLRSSYIEQKNYIPPASPIDLSRYPVRVKKNMIYIGILYFNTNDDPSSLRILAAALKKYPTKTYFKMQLSDRQWQHSGYCQIIYNRHIRRVELRSDHTGQADKPVIYFPVTDHTIFAAAKQQWNLSGSYFNLPLSLRHKPHAERRVKTEISGGQRKRIGK